MENEIELIKGCRAGKDSARKELYTLYSKQMLAVCFRYTGDMDAAHDVLHDGFIKIFTNFSFRGESSLSTWITRVMVTQSLDYLRRKKRVSQLVVHEDELPDIPDISDSGGGAGISEEQLMAFIAELPDGCRTVFNLYVFEEKSHKEIAKMLHIKEHSSTSQLHRAKYLLAKRIKEYRNHEERKWWNNRSVSHSSRWCRDECPGRLDFCDANGENGQAAIHRCIHAVVHLIEDHAKKAEIPARFAATKLVEGDKLILQQLGLDRNEEETLEHMIHEMEEECAKDREAALADMRFKFSQNHTLDRISIDQ